MSLYGEREGVRGVRHNSSTIDFELLRICFERDGTPWRLETREDGQGWGSKILNQGIKNCNLLVYLPQIQNFCHQAIN